MEQKDKEKVLSMADRKGGVSKTLLVVLIFGFIVLAQLIGFFFLVSFVSKEAMQYVLKDAEIPSYLGTILNIYGLSNTLTGFGGAVIAYISLNKVRDGLYNNKLPEIMEQQAHIFELGEKGEEEHFEEV
jgi:hypothetical protein